MRRCAFPVLALLLLAGPASAKKVHGFVTAVHSPTSWEIDDYKIDLAPGVAVAVQDAKSDRSAAAFKASDIAVGNEVEIEGDYTESTHELKAHSVKVFFFDTVRVIRIAALEKPPDLKKNGLGGWNGFLFADGQRIAISDSTVIGLSTDLDEHKQAKAAKGKNTKIAAAPAPIASLDAIWPGSFIYYDGVLANNGAINAAHVYFAGADIAPAEAKFIKRLAPKIKEPDYARNKPGQAKLPFKSYKILPDRDVQNFISSFGESLIPESQRALPDGSPAKIAFKFYVAADRTPDVNAYLGGVVIVNSGLLEILQNQAQLAFALSHEMAHSVERSSWRNYEYHRGATLGARAGTAVAGLAGSFFIPGFGLGMDVANAIADKSMQNDPYAHSLENQADRDGLEWAFDAGYDIREAPAIWQVISQKYASFLKQMGQDPDLRRSYLNAQIELHYSDVDFSKLKKDADTFHRIAGRVLADETKKHAARTGN